MLSFTFVWKHLNLQMNSRNGLALRWKPFCFLKNENESISWAKCPANILRWMSFSTRVSGCGNCLRRRWQLASLVWSGATIRQKIEVWSAAHSISAYGLLHDFHDETQKVSKQKPFEWRLWGFVEIWIDLVFYHFISADVRFVRKTPVLVPLLELKPWTWFL